MADDEERRAGTPRSSRRDPARNVQRAPPVIEGMAQDVTPAPAATIPADMTDVPTEGSATLHPVDELPPPELADTSGSDAAPHATMPQSGAESSTTRSGAEASEPPVAAEPYPGPTTATSHDPQIGSETAAAPTRSLWTTLGILGFLVLAAGLIYVLSQLAALPPNNSAAVADLKTRVVAMESRPASDTSGLGNRLDTLQAESGQLQSSLAALGKRVDGLDRIGSAQANLATEITQVQSGIAGVKTALAAVETSVAQIPRPDLGKVDARIADLDQRLGVLQAAVSNIPHLDLGPITGKIDDLQARLRPVETEVQQAGSPAVLAQRKAAPIAVTAQAVSSAIEAGRPFSREFRALQALGVEPGTLSPLQGVADSGAPALSELRTSLDSVRDRMVSQGSVPVAGSYVDRLVAGASSLVQVRPLGTTLGDTPSAIVSRMDAAIGSDDLGTALTEWKRLPEASQSVSKAVVDRIKLRLDAETAARAIVANAIGAMAGPKN